MCKKSCCKLSKLLVLIGAINWGLIGLFNFNLVEVLLGSWPMVVRILYIIIGLAGVMGLIHMCKSGSCKSGACAPPPSMGGEGMPPM